ncbi:hypothetical protein V6N12_060273 [Hibiscus sabdariffa]|uniref:Uncharacterized protein n=1 Tax=Hibiscus sabdariffa TaxID=183260 RepID=A0ABR2D6Q4_9ROSI
MNSFGKEISDDWHCGERENEKESDIGKFQDFGIIKQHGFRGFIESETRSIDEGKRKKERKREKVFGEWENFAGSFPVFFLVGEKQRPEGNGSFGLSFK